MCHTMSNPYFFRVACCYYVTNKGCEQNLLDCVSTLTNTILQVKLVTIFTQHIQYCHHRCTQTIFSLSPIGYFRALIEAFKSLWQRYNLESILVNAGKLLASLVLLSCDTDHEQYGTQVGAGMPFVQHILMRSLTSALNTTCFVQAIETWST